MTIGGQPIIGSPGILLHSLPRYSLSSRGMGSATGMSLFEYALPIGKHDTVHAAFDPSALALDLPRQGHRVLCPWLVSMYRR